MIGPDHLPSAPTTRPARARPLRIAVVTGTRAEFGLLGPVMRAVEADAAMELLCVVAGAHLIQPATTFREVKARFRVADSIPMQVAGRTGRVEDAEALGRGVGRFTRSFDRLRPDWVVVLGDRIEAFAAAIAASVAGFALAHVHGGDRAEGIADESMRHAITKLANAHFPATPASAERIIRMGEPASSVFVVGSPAIDALASIPAMADDALAALGSPTVVFLMHPVGRHPEQEEAAAAAVLGALGGERVLALHPNHDAGREGIVRAIAGAGVATREHLARDAFVGLLRRLATMDGARGGVLVGNSSAGLIEAAALRLPVVDVGSRQHGRERAGNAVHAGESAEDVRGALARARALDRSRLTHPYGDGRAGEAIARILATLDPHAPGEGGRPSHTRKLITY